MKIRAGRLIWAVVLVAAGASFGLVETASGEPAAATCTTILCGPTTTSTTTTTTTTTPTTTTVPRTTTTAVPPTTSGSGSQGGYVGGFAPCSPTGTAPCDQDPANVQVRYPAGGPPAAVEVDWVADGRPAAAPNPASATATLAWSAGTDCGSDRRCWTWPSVLTDHRAILNGTYRVNVCGAYGAGGACQSKLDSATVGLAVPPAPPSTVKAVASGPQVTLSWSPPPGAAPDLAGYQITRNAKQVYACALSGLGAPGAAPCPQPLTVIDRPARGTYTYAVSSLRLGVDATSQHAVASAPALEVGGPISVPGPAAASAGSGGSGFRPAPVIGAPGTMITFAPPAASPVATLPGEDGSAVDPGTGPQNLHYPAADPLPSGQSSTLALDVGESGPKKDVVPIGMVGLGVLVLAIAAHVVYLRSRISAIQARGGDGPGPAD